MDAWRMLAVCVALFLPELVTSLFRHGAGKRKRDRPTVAEASAHLAMAVSQAAVLALCLQGGWWAVRQPSDWWVALFLGALLSFVPKRAWARWEGSSSTNAPAPPDLRAWLSDLAGFWPRQRWARGLVFARTVFTSTTEEVVRCIFAFGPDGGELMLGGAVFAVGFNVVMHWYQGRKHVVFHALYAVAAMGVMTRLGLLAAIAMHVTYNVTLYGAERRTLQYVKQWRAYQRSLAAASQPSDKG